MAEEIKDGTGTGNKLAINSKNQAAVASVSVDEITHISSVDGYTFQFHLERALTASNTFEVVGHMKYTGEYQLQIESILFSREDVALSSSGQAVVELMSNVSYTSGGDLTEPINLNLGSSNVSDTTFYSGTTTIIQDTSLKEEILDTAFNNVYNHSFKGSLILKKGDTISVIGKSLNIGDVIHAIVFGYIVKDTI